MNNLFEVSKKTVVITGGAGVIGSAIAKGFHALGANVAIVNRKDEDAQAMANTLGGSAKGYGANVLKEDELKAAKNAILKDFGSIDVLINVAGGNMKGATIGPDQTFYDLSIHDFEKVVSLNLKGTVLPTMIFSEPMAEQKSGSIINISSMTASQPFTRVVGYGAAKAGIDNFTKWLSVEMNAKFGEGIRVNAIAPGVFIGKQNKDLLVDADGKFTKRGNTIIEHTPMRRFGLPEELVGTAVWLSSEASKFVNGIVVPVDGGFSAFSGV